MAHNLGLRVVAEGVETKAQLKFLEKHDCDEVQGFLYSRPLPALRVPAFLDSRAAMTPAGRRRVPKMAAVALATAAIIDEEALGRLLWEESGSTPERTCCRSPTRRKRRRRAAAASWSSRWPGSFSCR